MLKTLVLLTSLCLCGFADHLLAQPTISGNASPTMVLSHDTLRFWNAVIVSDSIKPRTDGKGYYARSASVSIPQNAGYSPLSPPLFAPDVTVVCLSDPPYMKLYESAQGDSILLYDGAMLFWGHVRFSENEVVGHGSIRVDNFSMHSDSIVFNGAQGWKAYGCTVGIYDEIKLPNKLLVDAHNAELQYDAQTKELKFVSGILPWGGVTFYTQGWQTTLLRGTYHLDTKTMDLIEGTIKPTGFMQHFLAKADSTVFRTKSLHYAISDQRITLSGVPYIYIADAKIMPDSNQVIILPDGHIQDLKGASIDCNEKTRYHRFYDATVHIESRNKYTAIAQYDYPSIMGKHQGIPFALQVQGDSMTIGAGALDADTFYLNEGMRFRDKATMTSQLRYPRFMGEIQVAIDHPNLKGQWFKADIVGNPDSIILPMGAAELSKLSTGLHFDPRKREFYTTFLEVKRDISDPDVARAGGALTFDRNTDEFRIGPASKLSGDDYRGTSFGISRVGDTRTVVGKLNFPTHILDKTIGMTLAGMWRDDTTRDEAVTKLVGQFDLDCIPKAAWEKLQDKATISLALNSNVDWNDAILRQGLAELLDPKANRPPLHMQEFQSQVTRSLTYLDIKAATVNPASLLLGGMEMRYDPELRSLWSSGEVDVLGIAGRPMNKRSSSNTKIEYVFGPTALNGVALSDTLRIYLEFDEMNWVFFEWYDDVVRTVSSDDDGYNAEVTAHQKARGYRFKRISEEDKDQFLNRFVNQHIWRTARGPSTWLKQK